MMQPTSILLWQRGMLRILSVLFASSLISSGAAKWMLGAPALGFARVAESIAASSAIPGRFILLGRLWCTVADTAPLLARPQPSSLPPPPSRRSAPPPRERHADDVASSRPRRRASIPSQLDCWEKYKV